VLMKYKDTKINQGGLMRYCLASLSNWIEQHLDDPIEEGKIITCEYETVEKDQMILKGNIWCWNRA